MLYDMQNQNLVDTIMSKKKSQGQGVPTLIDISHDDNYTIEAI